MRFRYVSTAALLFVAGIIIAGCGGGTSEAPTLTQQLQGEWVGTVNDPGRPDAAKCELTISGSHVEGQVQDEGGTVIGTLTGTVDDEGNINVEFEYEGESVGENGTIGIDDETGEVEINVGDNDEGGEDVNVGDEGGQDGETRDPAAAPKITLRRK